MKRSECRPAFYLDWSFSRGPRIWSQKLRAEIRHLSNSQRPDAAKPRGPSQTGGGHVSVLRRAGERRFIGICDGNSIMSATSLSRTRRNLQRISAIRQKRSDATT